MIDDHLKRYELALGHLFRLGERDEMIQYAVQHLLYREALQLFRVVVTLEIPGEPRKITAIRAATRLELVA